MVHLLSKLKNGSLLQRSFLEVFGQQIQMNKTLPPTLTGLVSNTLTLPAAQTAGLAFLSLIAGGEEYWEIQECCPTRSPEVGAAGSYAGLKPNVGLFAASSLTAPNRASWIFSPFAFRDPFWQSRTLRNIGYFTHGQRVQTHFNQTAETPAASPGWEQHRL